MITNIIDLIGLVLIVSVAGYLLYTMFFQKNKKHSSKREVWVILLFTIGFSFAFLSSEQGGWTGVIDTLITTFWAVVLGGAWYLTGKTNQQHESFEKEAVLEIDEDGNMRIRILEEDEE